MVRQRCIELQETWGRKGAAWVALVVIKKNSFGGTIEVFVLSTAKRPEKGAKRHSAQPHSHRYQNNDAVHFNAACLNEVRSRNLARGAVPGKRRELATTATEENDIATAATRGVT